MENPATTATVPVPPLASLRSASSPASTTEDPDKEEEKVGSPLPATALPSPVLRPHSTYQSPYPNRLPSNNAYVYAFAMQECMLGVGCDLGLTGVGGKGLDGDWGPKTEAAFLGLSPEQQQVFKVKAEKVAATAQIGQAPHQSPVPTTTIRDMKARAVVSPAAASSQLTQGGVPGDKTAVFDMGTGILTLPNGKAFCAGSGKGDARNNYKFQHEQGHGPIPEGTWNVDPSALNTYKLVGGRTDTTPSLRLSPTADVDASGRDPYSFLVHHTHAANPDDLHTIGCVALRDRDMPQLIAAREAGVFNKIRVTRDAGALPQIGAHTSNLKTAGLPPRLNPSSNSTL